MRRDGGWLERLPVKKRLIVMTFLVVLVTVALVSGCIGAFSYRTISTQAMDARAQLAHFTAASIAKRMQECLRLTDLILSQDLVKDAISRTASGEASAGRANPGRQGHFRFHPNAGKHFQRRARAHFAVRPGAVFQ